MVILDGSQAEDSCIDPAKHRFIGMFRYPTQPSGASVWCRCGIVLHTVTAAREHWQARHMDLPQYVTINPEKLPIPSVT